MVMKIIITERQFKLIEQELGPFNDESEDDGLNNNEPNVFTYKSLRSFSAGKTKLKYFNNLEPLDYDPSIPDEIKLLNINDKESYLVDKSEFSIGVDKFGNKNGKVKEEYFLKKFSNNSKSEPEIESKVIRSALEKTFNNNWVSNDDEFSPGIRGIYKIGDYLSPKTSEDWSILNYFDTKKEVKNMIYDELVKRNLPLDDLVDSISTLFKDKSFMNTLVNRQWQSIVDGEIRERKFMGIMEKILNSTNSKTYLPGSKMDRFGCVDVTIDDINYQVKPLNNYKINKNGEYEINTYGMKSMYLTKKQLHKIVFCNDNEVLIFDNKNYTVPTHYSAIFKDKPEIYKIEN